ncbi:hypothetical protein D9757_011378 [Collybiopsis confluens]|uniref:Uncharacterized protein n=1 Tax=Collybiopsis confluens TaxID=2823264 RepID=A0A8H5GKZ1_9AGAR|nr:hypothetical protein D9757_013630 [Collybiopsis confluens]KAF5366913.1 hypothetical protein D9757_011378 [Collybiopsis confluens]
MPQVSLVRTNLATVGIESFLFGIFFVLTASSIILTIYRQKRMHGNRSLPQSTLALWKQPMSYGTVILAFTVTTHWTLTIFRLFQAFVLVDDGKNAEQFYGDLRATSLVVKTAFLFSSLITSDALIIYRLWIVWSYNMHVIIFPVFTLIGLTVCGIGLPVQLASFSPDLDIFARQAGQWITSDCAFTLCTNLYSTIMIGYKIWRINRVTLGMSYGARNLLSIMGIFVESAAIYTAWTIFVFVTYLSGSNLQFLGSDIWPYAAGISFMLINVRVSLGWAATSRQKTFAALNVAETLATMTGEEPVFDHRNRFPMRPVAVNITQATETMGDPDHFDSGKDQQIRTGTPE